MIGHFREVLHLMVVFNFNVYKSHLGPFLHCRFMTPPSQEIEIQGLGPQNLHLGLVCSCFLITASIFIKLFYDCLHV